MAWNRAVISDIEESIDCGVDAVAISVSVSDIHIKHKLRTSREWVLENMIKSVEFAKKNGLYVSVNGEDASRADKEFLIEFINAAKQAGAPSSSGKARATDFQFVAQDQHRPVSGDFPVFSGAFPAGCAGKSRPDGSLAGICSQSAVK